MSRGFFDFGDLHGIWPQELSRTADSRQLKSTGRTVFLLNGKPLDVSCVFVVHTQVFVKQNVLRLRVFKEVAEIQAGVLRANMCLSNCKCTEITRNLEEIPN